MNESHTGCLPLKESSSPTATEFADEQIRKNAHIADSAYQTVDLLTRMAPQVAEMTSIFIFHKSHFKHSMKQSLQTIGLCLLTGLTFAQNGVQNTALDARKEIGNLVVENIPALPADLLDRVDQYQNVRGASFADWDRDSKGLFISTRFGDVPQIHHVAAPGADRRQITFFKELLIDISVCPDKAQNGFIYSRDNGGNENYQICFFNLADGRSLLLTDGKSRNNFQGWNQAGTQLAFMSNQRNGADLDLFLLDFKSGSKPTPLAELKGGGWVVLDWSADGKQMMLGNYKKTYVKLDNGPKREDSVKDIGALLDWIAKQPDLDANRVGVIGGSYGGYMCLATMTNYNDRMRCGIDLFGIGNFTTFLKNTSAYRADLRRAEYGDERDPAMQAVFEKISPINKIKNITKPMLVYHGKNDPRVPLSESEQMVSGLKQQGNTVWYIMAKDEGHSLAKKANRDYTYGAMMLFLRDNLLNGANLTNNSSSGNGSK